MTVPYLSFLKQTIHLKQISSNILILSTWPRAKGNKIMAQKPLSLCRIVVQLYTENTVFIFHVLNINYSDNYLLRHIIIVSPIV